MSEKDQKPTEKRLRDAREKGEVVHSGEIVAALVFVVVIAALASQAQSAIDVMRGLFDTMLGVVASRDPASAIQTVIALAIRAFALLGVGIVVLAGFAGAAGALIQVGGLFAFQRIIPRLERLDPANGLKQMFSLRSMTNLAKTATKTVCLSVTLWVLLRGSLEAPLDSGYLNAAGILAITGRLLLMLISWAAVIFVCFAVVDYAHQRHEFMKRLRMSVDDVRREYREMEGDPHMNARRRRMAREQIFNAMQERVEKSSAVVYSINVAVALRYNGPGTLPWVSARGEEETAQRIVELGQEFLVPTVFDTALAEALYESVREFQYIDRTLFRRVAKLLHWAAGDKPPGAAS